MPRIGKNEEVEVKLDGAAGLLQGSLTAEMRRGLFERPGSAVVAVVELASVTYTGHADGEEKQPQVKLRLRFAEAALNDEDAERLREVGRALMRKRRMEGTFDELGAADRDAERAVIEATRHLPSEGEFREHQEREAHRKGRGSRIEQHG